MPKYKKKAEGLKPFKVRDQLSPYLRQATTLISRNRAAEALAILNDQVAKGIDSPEKLSQVVSLIGDAEYQSARYDKALEAYRRAGQVLPAGERIRVWIRPALGEVRSLLKAIEPEKALQRANEIWNRAVESHRQLQEELETSTEQLQAQGKIKISQRPVRPSVVLTRLGSAFLENGYMDVAKHFFQQAVLTSPRGATRARQGMATVCLAEDDPAEAEKYAREALQMGKFQAKTICIWETLIKARAKQNKDLLDTELFTSLNLNQRGKVRARAVLSIIRSLRSYGDPRWKEIAEEWVARPDVIDERIEVEIAKILLSDEKLIGGDSRIIALAAFRVFRSDQVSPMEMVATAKDVVHMLLLDGSDVNFTAFADKANRRFSKKRRGEVFHAMALGAMKAKRHDLAGTLLRGLLAETPVESMQWGQDCLALARMESFLKNHDAAAEAYFLMAQNEHRPVKFRVHALASWADELGTSATANGVDLEQFTALLDNLIPELESSKDLLLVARKLHLCRINLDEIVQALLARIAEKVGKEFATATSPEEANLIIVRYCRKLFYDFRRYEEVIQTWTQLAPEKREWLWSQKSEYWEWLALVADSYVQTGQNDSASALIEPILSEPGVLDEGKIRMGTVKAVAQIQSGQTAEALALMDAIIKEKPTHRVAATSYYWLGLALWAAEDMELAERHFASLRRCFAGKPSLLSEWELDARAIVMLKKMDVDYSGKLEIGLYSRLFLDKQTYWIGQHLSNFGG